MQREICQICQILLDLSDLQVLDQSDKGDIFSSLENVVLVAKVNKNYLSHLGLQKSGLTVSSILKH